MCFVLSFLAVALAAGPGFRSEHLLNDHFEKYGAAFGHITRAQYLQLARQLRDARGGGNILEFRRADGVIGRFDRRHGYYGTYDPDGFIRTFFIPVDGVRFFERQARR